MGLMASSVSITRYRVEGKLKEPVVETLQAALQRYAIPDIADETADKLVGWTAFETPYQPNFEGSSFVFGTHFVFALRIDKKSLPNKIVQKYYTLEKDRLLKKTGRNFLSRDEKKMLKDQVVNQLSLRIPATPNIYDIVWNYEDSALWFFSNLKTANEELESLFLKAFKLVLVRLFPYTRAESTVGISDAERDQLNQLTPNL